MGRMPPKLRGKKAPSPEPSAESDNTTAENDPLSLSSSPAASIASGLQTINLDELNETFDPNPPEKHNKNKSQDSDDDEDDEDDEEDPPLPPPPKPKPGPASKKLRRGMTPIPVKKATTPTVYKDCSNAVKIKTHFFKPKLMLPRKIKPKASKPASASKTKLSKKEEKPTKGTKSKLKEYEDNEDDPEEETNASENEEEDEEEEIQVTEREKMENDGRNIFALMSTEDTQEFLSRLQRQCSPLDRAMHLYREKNIKWSKVSFGAYGDYQCKCVWMFLRSHTRKHRIMYEVINEVKLKLTDSVTFQFKLIESMPGFPQKPPLTQPAFNMYNRDKWNELKESVRDSKDIPNFIKYQQQCKEEYNNLSNAERQKYEDRAALAQADYERQVKAFYAANPGVAKLVERLHEQEALRKSKLKKLNAEVKKEKRKNDRAIKKSVGRTDPSIPRKKVLRMPNPYSDAPQPPQTPVVLFIQAKLNRIDPPPSADDIPHYKTRFLNKWKKLGSSKKVKWVDYCISLCEEFFLELERYRDEHPGYSVSKSLKIKHLLTREEIALWETEHGKPVTPKGTVFELFMEELLESDPTLSEMEDNERETFARNKWTELDWYHKEMYRMKYKISIVEYKKQIQTFFSELPEFMKEWCLERIPKRFHKICNEVDTVPPDASTEVPNKDDQPPPPKKRKKDAKKNTNAKQCHVEETSNNHDDPVAENITEQQHVFEEPNPNVKKRKRKERDPDLITGDILSDSQSESQTDGEGEHRRSKGGLKTALFSSSVPIYQQDVTENIKNELNLLKGKVGMDEKFSEAVKHQVEMMQGADEKTIHHITEAFVKKTKRAKNLPSTKVTQRDIFNTIRGIFDARAHLGYDYNVYYYYAKHVGADRYWIDCVNSEGLEKAALKIIETYVSLTGHEKEVFVEDSARWHMSLKHSHVNERPRRKDLYPGEPRPPPRTVGYFYHEERHKLRKIFPNIEYPDFTMLEPMTQNYYLKKLYHETKSYMRRYDEFIKSMTPNDLVSYAVFKARNWEKELYLKSTIKKALWEYVFPICKKESKTSFDREIQAKKPLQEGKLSKNEIRERKRKLNPFSDDIDLIKISKKMPAKKRALKRAAEKLMPLHKQIEECRRIVKEYADKNIVDVASRPLKRGTRLIGCMTQRRMIERRRLNLLLAKIRRLEKKAKAMGVFPISGMSANTKGDADADAGNNETQANKGEGEGQIASGSNGNQNPVNVVGSIFGSRRKRSRIGIRAGRKKNYTIRVSKKRRVDSLELINGKTTVAPNLDMLKDDNDDVSDTEVKFSLFPRVKPDVYLAPDGNLKQRNDIPNKFRNHITKSIDNWRKRRELILHRAKKYFYNIDDILKEEKIKEPAIKYKYNSSTQTEHFYVVSDNGTQTPKTPKYVSRGSITLIRGIRKKPYVSCHECWENWEKFQTRNNEHLKKKGKNKKDEPLIQSDIIP